ncbi:hypothetical protein [Bartonella sp. AA74HLJMH]|uniref:hypothetical protein n=1 Tax=Bartonella sp. AA74HLJMH TaxID=3243436 RepID=UPI0035D0D478
MRILLKGVVVLKGGENGENALESLVTREVKRDESRARKNNWEREPWWGNEKKLSHPQLFSKGSEGLIKKKKASFFS